MKVTIQVEDHSNPAMPSIFVHNAWLNHGHIELEVDGKRYTVNSEEMKSAIERATLNYFGR